MRASREHAHSGTFASRRRTEHDEEKADDSTARLQRGGGTRENEWGAQLASAHGTARYGVRRRGRRTARGLLGVQPQVSKKQEDGCKARTRWLALQARRTASDTNSEGEYPLPIPCSLPLHPCSQCETVPLPYTTLPAHSPTLFAPIPPRHSPTVSERAANPLAVLATSTALTVM